MSIAGGSAAAGGAYAVQFKPLEQPQQAARTQAVVAAAQQALAIANSIVDQDRRNHSPSCVACDQKLVDKAQAQLAQARASANDQTTQSPLQLGSTVDFIASLVAAIL